VAICASLDVAASLRSSKTTIVPVANCLPFIIGGVRIETKFAWKFTRINSSVVVWLEKYEIHYIYEELKYRIEIPFFDICLGRDNERKALDHTHNTIQHTCLKCVLIKNKLI
jgi:hypothetical protein